MKPFLMLVCLIGYCGAAMAAPEVGDMAPDFELIGSDGQVHRLSEYRGRQGVVIAFFPKAYTGGCTIECKALRDSSREIENYNVAYFMASTDEPEDNRGFAEQNDAPFPILSDPGKEQIGAYGVLSERGLARRWTFYIDDKGIIRLIDKTVDPKRAGIDLVENLDALGFERRQSS